MKKALLCLLLLPALARAADTPNSIEIRKICVNNAEAASRYPIGDFTMGDVEKACTCIGESFTHELRNEPDMLMMMFEIQTTEFGEGTVFIPVRPYRRTRELRYDHPTRVAVVEAMKGYLNCTQYLGEARGDSLRYELYTGAWVHNRKPRIDIPDGEARHPKPLPTPPPQKPGAPVVLQIPMQ